MLRGHLSSNNPPLQSFPSHFSQGVQMARLVSSCYWPIYTHHFSDRKRHSIFYDTRHPKHVQNIFNITLQKRIQNTFLFPWISVVENVEFSGASPWLHHRHGPFVHLLILKADQSHRWGLQNATVHRGGTVHEFILRSFLGATSTLSSCKAQFKF